MKRQYSRELPSRDTILALFDYNREFGEFVWKYNPNMPPEWNSRYAGNVAGSKSDAYIRICINYSYFYAHHLVWVVENNKPPQLFIDHINGNRKDNRIDNLREATNAENCRNAKISKNNTSGYKGVYWMRRISKWGAKIMINGKSVYLGSYRTKEEAHMAYCSGAIHYHGEFASFV